MDNIETKPISQNVPQEPTKKYLVVSALADEIEAFYETNLAFNNRVAIGDGVNKTIIEFPASKQTILTFTSTRMGMPHNAAAIMQVIEKHQPAYILFIGTCASIKDGAKLGDVVVPKSVFNYELGKYKNLLFSADFESYKMSELILQHAESLRSSNPKPAWLNFKVITDDDFTSGSVVVDSAFIKWRIKWWRTSRKANGLDMEAYSLGAIQYLQKLKHVGVIKGVMDLGVGKTDNSKTTAMKNAAKFAYELICHIESADARAFVDMFPQS